MRDVYREQWEYKGWVFNIDRVRLECRMELGKIFQKREWFLLSFEIDLRQNISGVILGKFVKSIEAWDSMGKLENYR